MRQRRENEREGKEREGLLPTTNPNMKKDNRFSSSCCCKSVLQQHIPVGAVGVCPGPVCRLKFRWVIAQGGAEAVGAQSRPVGVPDLQRLPIALALHEVNLRRRGRSLSVGMQQLAWAGECTLAALSTTAIAWGGPGKQRCRGALRPPAREGSKCKCLTMRAPALPLTLRSTSARSSCSRSQWRVSMARGPMPTTSA